MVEIIKKYHYTYRIINKKNKKEYIGVRTSTFHPKDDLGIYYFSSSSDKEFISMQKSNPEFFEYKIISVHPSRTSALSEEISLHSFFDIGRNKRFYNKAKQTSVGFDRGGLECSIETKRKISKSKEHISQTTRKNISEGHKNRPKPSEETKLKTSLSLMGHKVSTSTRNKISNTQKGRVFSNEQKENMSKASKGKPKPKITCPHCHKIGGAPQMKRYHFDNCKFINTKRK